MTGDDRSIHVGGDPSGNQFANSEARTQLRAPSRVPIPQRQNSEAMPAPDTLPGLNLTRLSEWFSANLHYEGGQLTGRLLVGGRSNLTFEVTDGKSTWIIRRPPLGHVLATAHDMSREYRVMSALQKTAVPVPQTFAICESPDVIGAPFQVMARVAGTPYRRAAQLEALGPKRTRVISTELIDSLALLHSVDPASVGLADFGRSEGYLARQVQRWRQQLDASYNRDLPSADELHARLAAHIPRDSAPAIVHGDYRLDNVLIDDRGRAAALLDWEMATVGDPLTDLALLLVYRRLGELFGGTAVADASSAPGFLTEEEMVQRYVWNNGRDPYSFGFYLGLAAFKVAGIIEGIHYRHLRGKTVGPGYEQFADMVEPMVDVGLTALKEYR